MALDLAAAVEAFDARLRPTTDADLDRPWAWGVYDEEGVRFAFFRTIEELGDAAVEVAARREATGPALTRAQAILGRYHVAWRELWSIVDEGGEGLLELRPDPDEWSLRLILEHLIGADLGFFVTQRYAMDRRAAGREPARVGEEEWPIVAAISDEEYEAIFAGPLDAIRAFHVRVHDRIIAELDSLSDSDLAAESLFWDGSMPNRFRLGRFESHLRQHTIQLEKTLQAVSGPPREVDRLLRLVRRAQGDLEAAAIGAEGVAAEVAAAAAASIEARVAELTPIVAVPM